MSIMAAGYMACLDGLHWSTAGAWRRATYLSMAALLAAAWVVYFTVHNFEVFATLFTLQVVAPELISYAAATGVASEGRAPKTPSAPAAHRGWWWVGLASIVGGKALWEWERSLYRSGTCPERGDDLRFWLHPAWHVLSAFSHFSWTTYVVTSLLPLSDKAASSREKTNDAGLEPKAKAH